MVQIDEANAQSLVGSDLVTFIKRLLTPFEFIKLFKTNDYIIQCNDWKVGVGRTV